VNKLDACRAAIVAGNPDLERDPDRLAIWADKGRVVSRRTAAFGYEWRYRVNLLFEAFTASPDAIMIPLLVWLRDAQPDLLQNFTTGDDAVKFEAHILDLTSWDVLVQFELTEAVTLTPREGGGFDAVHPPEPSADDQLLGEPPAVPLGAIWLGDQQLVPPVPLDPPPVP
jgi:hypothetical protein